MLLLQKRDVSDEARDEHGRWTSTGEGRAGWEAEMSSNYGGFAGAPQSMKDDDWERYTKETATRAGGEALRLQQVKDEENLRRERAEEAKQALAEREAQREDISPSRWREDRHDLVATGYLSTDSLRHSITPPEDGRLGLVRTAMNRDGFDPSQPITAEYHGSERYLAGDGNHRLAIAREMGLSEVPVIVTNWTRDRLPNDFQFPGLREAALPLPVRDSQAVGNNPTSYYDALRAEKIPTVRLRKYNEEEARDSQGRWGAGEADPNTRGLKADQKAVAALFPRKFTGDYDAKEFALKTEIAPKIAARMTSSDEDIKALGGGKTREESVALLLTGFGYQFSNNENNIRLRDAAATVFGTARPENAPTDDGLQHVREDLVRAQYAHTQEVLKDADVSNVAVFRGVGFRGAADGPAWAGEVKESGAKLNVSMTQNGISSWSTQAALADSYAKYGGMGQSGVVTNPIRLYTAVPAERVLSLGATGFGQSGDREVVVIGDTMRVNAVAVKP